MSPSLQLNSQLAGLGAKCVQVQPFQQVQQHAKMMQQVLQQSNGTSTTEDANDTTEPGNAAAATE